MCDINVASKKVALSALGGNVPPKRRVWKNEPSFGEHKIGMKNVDKSIDKRNKAMIWVGKHVIMP
jgi:hypothetical protein